MKHKRMVLALAVIALLLVPVAGAVLAQTSANYNLEWHTIGGGGQEVTSASFQVNGTLGQAAASPRAVDPLYPSNSQYAVSGGYWFGESITLIYPIYLPIVVRALP